MEKREYPAKNWAVYVSAYRSLRVRWKLIWKFFTSYYNNLHCTGNFMQIHWLLYINENHAWKAKTSKNLILTAFAAEFMKTKLPETLTGDKALLELTPVPRHVLSPRMSCVRHVYGSVCQLPPLSQLSNVNFRNLKVPIVSVIIAFFLYILRCVKISFTGASSLPDLFHDLFLLYIQTLG